MVYICADQTSLEAVIGQQLCTCLSSNPDYANVMDELTLFPEAQKNHRGKCQALKRVLWKDKTFQACT